MFKLILSICSAILLVGCNNAPFVGNMEPAWSPDGSRIAFTSTRNGNTDIYVMDSDGSHVTQLTGDPFAFLYFFRSPADRMPAWSPDSRRIAFISGRDNNMMSHVEMHLYVMDSKGSDIVSLTGTNALRDIRMLTIGDAENHPAWNPDGTRIAFNTDGGYEFNQGDIYLINADGTNLTRLTNDKGSEDDPAWSPDGHHIAYVSNATGKYEIYTMDADGSNAKQLTGK